MSSSPVALGPDERARAERVQALVESGAEGVDPLLQMLTDPSWAVRRSVVAGLASLGSDAVDGLCEVLIQKRDSETRIAAAVDALVASVGNVEGAVTLKLASHPNPAVVADAAQILGRRREPQSAPVLAKLLEHADDNVAVSATEALGRVGGRIAVDALVRAAGSGNFFRVFPAIDVLGRSGDPRAVPPLAALLGNPMYAAEAARSLGRTAERGAVAPLSKLLASSSDSLVRIAASSLADLHRRHFDRYGEAATVEQALRSAVTSDAPVRRLGQTLSGADNTEQAAISLVLGILGGPAAIAPLTRLLDAVQEVSTAAATALRRLGHDSDEPALQTLRKGDSARRRALLPIVSRTAAADAVLECLEDADPTVRALAAEALARIGYQAAVPRLFKLLTDPNPVVTQAGVAAIQALGSDVTAGLAMEAAKAERPTLRRSALRILSYFGYAGALPIFLEALKDPDERVRDAALQGLPFLEDRRGLEALLQASRDPVARTRASAMRALGFAAGDLRIEAALLRGLGDEDDWVRYYACQALGRLGIETAVDRIAPLVTDAAGQVRVAAVEALSHMVNDRAATILETAARSQEEDLKRAALIGLGMSRRASSLPVLEEAARSEDPATRLVAISALADFPEPHVTSLLARAAQDTEDTVRTAAIGFLAGRAGVDATMALVQLLADPVRRAQAREALAIPAQGRVDAILSTLDNADEELAPELAAALARMHRPDATMALFRALETGNPAARKASATTLSALGTRQAMNALRDRAKQDPDPEVRRVCALLLAE